VNEVNFNLQNFLGQINGARIVSLKTKTPVKLLAAAKTVFPAGISKIAVRNGILGTDYTSVTNRALARNAPENSDVPEFQAESLWKGKGKNVSKFLVEHVDTGKQYLKFLPKISSEGHNVTKSIFIDNATGKEISKEKFDAYMPKQSSGQNFAGVAWQVVDINNIIDIA
jgi:hypothetical protein